MLKITINLEEAGTADTEEKKHFQSPIRTLKALFKNALWKKLNTQL